MDTPRKQILYIEDHEDTREFVILVLTNANYQVATTSSSQEALKLARERHFDLFILDSWLPDGSGIELCKQLREFDHETPIMFLSAAALETDRQTAMDSGAQRYLVKPADIEVLSFEVDALIRAFENKQVQPIGFMRTDSLEHVTADEPAMGSSADSLESGTAEEFLAPELLPRSARS
jgi:DNA-binding response OmpR family regulator